VVQNRPEGPSCNSHDRKVVVTSVINYRGGPKDRQGIMSALRASIVLLGDCYPDLTVGAIAWRRFAPANLVGASRLRAKSDFVFEVYVARDRFVGPWE
jgi:hypothetical protein